MRHNGFVLVVLAALGGGAAASLGGVAAAARGRAAGSLDGRAALVTVDVVVDRPGPAVDALHVVPWTVVRGLTSRDFEVLSDGVRCPVESVAADAGTLSLAVLFDVSASTEVNVEWLLEPVEKGLVPLLRPGDRVAFGRFGGGTFEVDERFASRPDELREAAHAALALPAKSSQPTAGGVGEGVIPRRAADPVLMVRGMNGAFALGGSPAWDAVDAAVTVLQPQPGRRAIILVTDGRSTGNVRSLQDAVARAQAAAIPVLAVGLGLDELVWQGAPSEEEGWKRGAFDDYAKARIRPSAPLELLASATGGAYAPVFGEEKGRPKRIDALANRPRQERDGGEPFHPAKVDERAFKTFVGRLLAAHVNDLHASYAVTFAAPARDGQLHALQVRVRQSALRVRAPQRYLAERPGIRGVRPDGGTGGAVYLSSGERPKGLELSNHAASVSRARISCPGGTEQNATMKTIKMEEMTWPAIRAAIDAGCTTVVVAVGSTEQHGPHLPTMTDARIGDALGELVARRLGGALVARTIDVGSSDHHLAFGGTLSLQPETLAAVLRDYVSSLARSGFRRIVFVPTHGGNFPAVQEAIEAGRRAHPGIDVDGYTDLLGFAGFLNRLSEGCGVTAEASGAHAGENETSMMMALEPGLVVRERFEAGYLGPLGAAEVKRILERGMPDLTANGVLGDPRGARAENGLMYLERLADFLVERLKSPEPRV